MIISRQPCPSSRLIHRRIVRFILNVHILSAGRESVLSPYLRSTLSHIPGCFVLIKQGPAAGLFTRPLPPLAPHCLWLSSNARVCVICPTGGKLGKFGARNTTEASYKCRRILFRSCWGDLKYCRWVEFAPEKNTVLCEFVECFLFRKNHKCYFLCGGVSERFFFK